jgi:hypothetical protein
VAGWSPIDLIHSSSPFWIGHSMRKVHPERVFRVRLPRGSRRAAGHPIGGKAARAPPAHRRRCASNDDVVRQPLEHHGIASPF